MVTSWGVGAALSGTITLAGLFSPVCAQVIQFDVPSEEAGASLPELARQAGIQVIAPGEKLHGVITPEIKGVYDVDVALSLMLKGTGLVASRSPGGIVISLREPNKKKEREEVSPELKNSASIFAIIFAAFASTSASAQSPEEIETVTVTGYRASLESALNTKRVSAEMVDAINAEDVAKFPDANLAESLQRLPGISVSRDNGEGRTIVVRGLGADFTRVTINDMEALSTAGGTSSGDNPNRSRQFDFNTFASELFRSLKVRKTASASTDEGSLGATVSLTTGHPLDMGEKFALSVNNATYETGHAFNPRVAAVASETFFGGKVGALISVAYNMRNQNLSYYSNGAGNYVYYGNNIVMNAAGTPSGTITRDGFASPAGTSCSGTTGVVPGVNVTNSAYCALLSGSDATAYATVNGANGYGHNAATDSTGAWKTPGPSNELGNPSLVGQEFYQSRLGLTASVQWQVNDDTLVTFDALFSSFYQKSTSNLIALLSEGRNNTNSALNTATSTTDLSSVFSKCTTYVATSLHAAQTCSYTNSMLPSAYYTTVGSAGYKASDPNGMLFLMSTVGRPSTKLVAAQVDNGIVDYLETNNNDIRSSADQTRATTQFQQGTLKIEHTFSSKLQVDAMYGMAQSWNHTEGILVTMDRLDVGTATGDGTAIYDIRGRGYAPQEVSFGTDVSDTSQWDFIKGVSALRRLLYRTENKYTNIATNISYQPIDILTLRFGFASRIFRFDTTRYTRVLDTTINPSLAEMGITSTDVMRSATFNASELGLGGATPTKWAVPDIDKFAKYTNFRCNCVNRYGDWTVSNLNSEGSGSNRTATFNVQEHDKSYYLEAQFANITVLGSDVRGNVGLRYATTDVISGGYTLVGYATKAVNSYDDLLPSVNLVYSLSDDMMLRFGAAKVMSRPVLANMAPSITGVSYNSATGIGSLSSGNPFLKPFRANTLDVSYEWYFAKGGVLSVAGFAKYVKNNPQSMVTSGPLSSLISSDMIAAVAANYTVGSSAYTAIYDSSATWQMTSYRNAPGGVLRGIEVNYQQQLNFLPAPFDGLGVNANYTFVQSKMHYLFRDGVSTTLVDHIAPWFGSSPNSFNATLYYAAKKWEARISTSYRSKYVDSYPVKAGAYPVGYGSSLATSEFIYGKSSFYMDASASYDLGDHISMKIDALNLTNEHSKKFWLYQGKTERETYDSAAGRQLFVGFTLKY